MTGQDVQLVRAAYLALEFLSVYLLVPLSFLSLLAGTVQSLGTTWVWSGTTGSWRSS